MPTRGVLPARPSGGPRRLALSALLGASCLHPPGSAPPVAPPVAAPTPEYLATWHGWTADPTRTFTSSDGVTRLEAGTPGTEPWHAQLYATIPPLQGPVELTATLSGPAGTPVSGMCQVAEPPYTWLIAPSWCAPTPEGAACRVECPDAPTATKLGFEMGGAAGPVEVTDVHFRRAVRFDPALPAAPVEVAAVARPIAIDGHLDEAAWRAGPGPTVVLPVRWQGASERHTDVRLRTDGERLYVGVHAVEPRLGPSLGGEPWADPWFVVLLDDDDDPAAGYGAAARVGSQDDFRWERRAYRGWNVGRVAWSAELGLVAAGAPTEDGFDLELSLPLSALAGPLRRVRLLRTDTRMGSGEYTFPPALPTPLHHERALLRMAPVAIGELSHVSTHRHISVVSPAPATAPDTPLPVRVGLHPGDVGNRWVPEYEARLGVRFDHELVFQRADALDLAPIRERLDSGHAVTLNIEFATGGSAAQDRLRAPVLQRIAAGAFDAELRAFAAALARDGREIQIRTLHEPNGDWYPWGVLHPSGENTVATFHAAWRRIVGLFRAVGAPARFQLNYNARNGAEWVTPFSLLYPGDEWVDSVAITTYNGSGPESFPAEWWQSFAEVLDEPYREVARMTRRPIAVAETATRTAPGCDKPAWIREAFDALAAGYPQVDEVTWFLEDKEGDWDLHEEADRRAFVDGLARLRAARPGP